MSKDLDLTLEKPHDKPDRTFAEPLIQITEAVLKYLDWRPRTHQTLQNSYLFLHTPSQNPIPCMKAPTANPLKTLKPPFKEFISTENPKP